MQDLHWDDTMDNQSEVGHFFEQLRRWREESEKEFTNFMQRHSGHISKCINDLVEEVSDLKVELSLIKIERNDLLETINNLSSDIRQRSEELPKPQPLLETEGIHGKDTQEEHRPIPAEVEYNKDKFAEISTISSETSDPDDINFNGSLDFNVLEYNENTVKEENHSQDETVGKNSMKEMDINSTPSKSLQHESKISKKTVQEEDHICPECNLAFSTSKKLGIHVENIHPELELIKNRESIQQKANKKFKCEQCPYTSATH